MTAEEYAREQGIAKTTARTRLKAMVADGRATVKVVPKTSTATQWQRRQGDPIYKTHDYTILKP